MWALLFMLCFPCFHQMRITDLFEFCKAYVCLVVEGVVAGVLNVSTDLGVFSEVKMEIRITHGSVLSLFWIRSEDDL